MRSNLVGSNVLLLPLNQKIDDAFAAAKADSVKLFARKFFASSANSVLARASEEDLFARISEAWDFVHLRRSAAPKIEFVHEAPEAADNTRPRTRIYLLVDDMPFVVDSARQCLNRMGALIRGFNNTVIHVNRAKRSKGRGGDVREVVATEKEGFRAEALSCFECAHLSEAHCKEIERELRATLKLVAAATKDYVPMCKRVADIEQRLRAAGDQLPVSAEELAESIEFISWILNNHFTFLGYEEYHIRHGDQGPIMELQRDSLLGLSRFKSDIKATTRLDDLPEGTAALILSKQICNFAKSSNRSKVHRPAYYDYILIKEFDQHGNVVTEHRFTGLYTSSVYYRPALDIPLVRKKVKTVLDHSGFSPNGHNIKDLLQVINVFPRDELFQMTTEQLFGTALEITQIQEIRACKLFVRRDSYGKFFSCLIFVPRDSYNTRVRLRIQDFLSQRLQASEMEYNIYLSESILARLHLVLRVPGIQNVKYDITELEEALSTLVKPWEDFFLEALQARYSDHEVEALFGRFAPCFNETYRGTYRAETAVDDIDHIQNVLNSGDLALDLKPCHSDSQAELRFKIFSRGQQLLLSEVDPILENLGMNIISEKTFRLQTEDEEIVWLHDFSLFRKAQQQSFKSATEQAFEDAFHAVWDGRTEDDGFNALVVNAELVWRDVALLRAYAAYLKQVQFGYSSQFIAETLSRHQAIARLLLQYFYALFDPQGENTEKKASRLRGRILAAVDAVVNLAEDSVLRAYFDLIEATLRSNFFQTDGAGRHKDYFSFKFHPSELDLVPRPRPQYEIFVYSRRVEGVHLRGGKVARGGLRWSDRREDYRTEVLGLVKAQQVKNSVIVPVGAKGGFVVKEALPADREAQQEVAIACYQTFIRGLLDLTDNIVDGEVRHPPGVLRRDEEDTYLVVAADKGTATFSDIANRIAAEYEFWLGDGFASGGSHGYDHKAMGITARGGWVSVQRHFRELGINIQEEDFTVLGIGDMSGDVFGNGMLLSRHICLVAAFNHRHIFIDPDPDAKRSFRERQRLFKKPRSTWEDYNRDLISSGGGIFDRSDKSIPISKEMKARFGIEKDRLAPNQLINQLLKSPVDLLWNGGIGTYVKASEESHVDVGDKANDPLRVNGDELRVRVIGEGGNLGLTQRARIEYALNGGICLTDFVDNSAGVDCSDHEVNIKILLNRLESEGKLTREQRNELLQSMTESVAELVLENNYSQVQTIGVSRAEVAERHEEYADLIKFLEAQAGMDRQIEHLPKEDELEERASRQEFLTRPELAVMTSYMKMLLKSQLSAFDYIDDAYLVPYLEQAFPSRLHEAFPEAIGSHPLRQRIIATQLANTLVNRLGPGFVYRMVDSTGASLQAVVQAAIVVCDAFQVDSYWRGIEALDYRVSSDTQTEMMSRLIRLVRRVTRWMLRNRHNPQGFADEVAYFAPGIAQFKDMLPDCLPPDYQEMFTEKLAHLRAQKVPEQLAEAICRCDFLFPATSFVEVSGACSVKLSRVVETYFAIGEELHLNWLGKIINQLPATNHWQVLAREAFLDDLAWQQRNLTGNVVSEQDLNGSASAQVRKWVERNQDSLSRLDHVLNELQMENSQDYAMFSVTLRELYSLSKFTAVRD